MEQLQSHILYDSRPPHYMGKYLRISPYIRKPFLIYDFETAPLWISLYMRNIDFLFYPCGRTVVWFCFLEKPAMGRTNMTYPVFLLGSRRRCTVCRYQSWVSLVAANCERKRICEMLVYTAINLYNLLCTFVLIECEAHNFKDENTYIYCQFNKPSNMSVGDITCSHSCKTPLCKCILNCVLGPKLFWGVFCTFSTDLSSASNFAYYDTHKEFLKTYFFCLY